MSLLLSPRSGWRYRRTGTLTGWSGLASLVALEPVVPVADFSRPRTARPVIDPYDSQNGRAA